LCGAESCRPTRAIQLSFDVNPDARRAVDEVASFIRYATTVQDKISA
jgi:epsilon-lactone hydrolase